MISWRKAFMRTRAHPNNTGPIGDPFWTTGDPWEPIRDPSGPTRANQGSIGAHQELFLASGMQTGSTRDLQGEPCDLNWIQQKSDIFKGTPFSAHIKYPEDNSVYFIVIFFIQNDAQWQIGCAHEKSAFPRRRWTKAELRDRFSAPALIYIYICIYIESESGWYASG